MSKFNIKIWLLLFSLTISVKFFAQHVQYELKTVVLDPGHGGKDPGATVAGVREKDIVLKVALKAGELIKKNHPNVKVVYTRSTDVFINLDERANIANKNNADLFISIHANYFKNPAISGTETYLLGLHRTQENLELAKLENSVILLEDDYTTRYEGFDPNSAESYIMFELIQDEFLEQSRQFADKVESQFKGYAKRPSRGVKQAGFLVLRRTTMPSVLIELGYLSNNNDRAYMQTDKGIDELAASVANAFAHYKNTLEGKSGVVAAKESGNLRQGNQLEVSMQSTPSEAKASQNSAGEKKTVPSAPASIVAPKQTQAIAAGNPVNKTKCQIFPASELKGKWFGIQIQASSKALRDNDPRISIYENVYQFEEGGLYKYATALSQQYSDVRKQINGIRERSPGAFPIAFVDGKKADINFVLQNQ
jgi:N-acetylmuramoyl-L-alanine amidase